MRALLVHQAFASGQEAGGTRHFEFGRHIVAAGHEFTVVTADVSYLTGRATRAARDYEQQEGVRILRAYTPRTLHRSFVWRAWAFVAFMFSAAWTSRHAGKVDVVIGTTPPIFQAAAAWVVSAVRRVPFVLEVRDLWPTFAIALGVLRNPVLIYLARLLESFLYRVAAHIIVNSPAYRDYLLARGIEPSRVTLIPNGVDPTMFDPAAGGNVIKHRLGLQGRFVVTYAGALGLANDIDTLLDAAERVRDHRDIVFLVVGDGKERGRLESAARQRELANVIFTGAQPKADMAEWLAASDACVAILRDIPEFRTTYPNKVFDYMAAGRPTILAIDGVISEAIRDANGGILVGPGNAAALADAVLALQANPPAARAMGASARRFVEARFNRNDHARHFLELLLRIARVE